MTCALPRLAKVTAWNEGLDLIYGVRPRWGVADEDVRPLGLIVTILPIGPTVAPLRGG
jgi:hypothetical protein